MKRIPAFLMLLSLAACNDGSGNGLDKVVEEPIKISITPDPLRSAIQSAIIDIETKDITGGGEIIQKMNIEGMEIINFSIKDYYSTELRSQEEDFKNYLAYLDRVSKNKSLDNPLKRRENQAKHDAVIAYLKKMIKTASANPDIHKVVYYLKAATKNIQYNQLKTTYLDKELKKITADYRFLKPVF